VEGVQADVWPHPILDAVPVSVSVPGLKLRLTGTVTCVHDMLDQTNRSDNFFKLLNEKTLDSSSVVGLIPRVCPWYPYLQATCKIRVESRFWWRGLKFRPVADLEHAVSPGFRGL
jgi:hypothetical protein